MMGVYGAEKFGRIVSKEREKEMRKIPTQATIGGKLNYYAHRAGFTVHPQTDGTIALFDIRAKYYVFRGARQRAIMFVSDELRIKSRQSFQSSPPPM